MKSEDDFIIQQVKLPMATALDSQNVGKAQLPDVPPLESGDRLTRAEFERRYADARNLRAELIEGVVYVHSAIRYKQHGNPHLLLMTLIGNYIGATPGLDGGDNASVRLDMDNEPQPDIVMRIESQYGGSSEIDHDGYLTGPPELVAEIAASTASYDLHDKLNAYRRNGVREYLVWRVLDEAFDWFVLREGSYERLPVEETGLMKSETFPGLWLDTAALLRGDLAAAIETLKPGLASQEHATFCAELKEKSKDGPKS